MNLILHFAILVLFSVLPPSYGGSITDYTDETCRKQNEKFLKNVHTKGFISEFKFTNETKKSVLLSWSSADTKTIILVATHGTISYSDVYFSDDYGRSFKLISEKFDKGKIYASKSIGLQRNKHDPSHILIVCDLKTKVNEKLVFVSNDDGRTWSRHPVNFAFTAAIEFYPKKPAWGLNIGTNGVLYRTKDGGKSWIPVAHNVQKFMWSSHPKDPVGTFYYMVKRQTNIIAAIFNVGPKDLMKMEDNKSPKSLRRDIWQFSTHGKFLYLSEHSQWDPRSRYMKVSTDGGKSFEEVQLMSITPDRFYSIMDMNEDLIFMHVDSPGNTGHGTLYTSGSEGILYSKSLDRHLYPNFPSVSDFYRVLSMRGVYITTQMNTDNSMHTVISFNRGAEWRRLRKPDNAECKAGLSDCNLQISLLFSKINKVKSNLPLSAESAPGIILAHGHAHKTLQTTETDVFVTSDGGYNWHKALKGVHMYQISDNGGLLVAVPTADNKNVKFSTDEGRCWHTYKYTDDDIIVTGVLTEPKNKIMNVVIWGYGKKDSIWRVYSIDFAKAVPRACAASDYEEWTPHAEMTHKNGDKWNGCLLGVKEKFKRLKKDSWCSNGETFEVTKEHKPCPCTEDDYECEYGYSRPVNSYVCQHNKLIKDLDRCIDGDLKKIMSAGYRKLPGDKCEKGFTPDRTKQVSLKKHCEGDEKGIDLEEGIDVNQVKQYVAAQKSKLDKSKIVWIVAGVCLGLVAIVLAAVIFSRYRQLRERHVNYKYSLLSTQNDEAFDTAMDVGLLDSQAEQNGQLLGKNTSNASNTSNARVNPVLRSYHDDSDVDMIE